MTTTMTKTKTNAYHPFTETVADLCRRIELRDNVTIDDNDDAFLPVELPEPIDIHDQELWLSCSDLDGIHMPSSELNFDDESNLAFAA